MLRHSESNGYLRAYCEKPGINAAGRTPRFWHGGGYVHDLTVREPSLPLLARRIACHSGVPCHHSWGCEPRSGVEPPTREPHDGFLPCMHSDAMSAAIRGPGAPEAVGGQPLLHGALLELLEGAGPLPFGPSPITCQPCSGLWSWHLQEERELGSSTEISSGQSKHTIHRRPRGAELTSLGGDAWRRHPNLRSCVHLRERISACAAML